MTDPHPAPDHHLPLQEVFPGIVLASSQIRMSIPLGLKVRFSRNMVAVLQDEGWVLINPVRLSAAAEDELTRRAPIRHAMRLGVFHGRDDNYYVDRHGATFWAVTEGEPAFDTPAVDHAISEDGALPIAGARAIVFRNSSRPECVLHLPDHRLLLTCDSVQNYEDDPLIDWLGRQVMKRMGFFTPCVIGPIWLKECTPQGGSLKPDFERILALDFDNLISGHGTAKLGGAHAALAANVARLRPAPEAGPG